MDIPNVPLRRETDYKFKKRYILVPVALLIVTVVGFSALKTSEKKPVTEATATASVDFDKSAPATIASGAGEIINTPLHKASKSVSPSNNVAGGAAPQTVPQAAPQAGTHFQLSLDVLKERENFKAQQQRWYAQLLFSGMVCLAAIYVVLSKKYPDDCNKWAYSTIAFVMGFWLKSM